MTTEQELIKAQEEYIEFLGNYLGSMAGDLYVHNMSPNKDITDAGLDHREKIKEIKSRL